MPRKQRFKPSRKPKPIPTAQPDSQSTLDGSIAQHIDMSRAPETEPPPAPADVKRGPHGDEVEAR